MLPTAATFRPSALKRVAAEPSGIEPGVEHTVLRGVYPLFYLLRAKEGGEPIDRESASSRSVPLRAAPIGHGPAGSEACPGALDVRYNITADRTDASVGSRSRPGSPAVAARSAR